MNCTLVMFEIGRYTLGVGGADDGVWSSVVSLRWQKGYRDVLFSCSYEISKHKCAFVCKHVYVHAVCICSLCE